MEPTSSLPCTEHPATCPILSQINPIHVHTSYLPSVLILPFTCSRSFKAVSYPHVSYQIMYTLLFFTIPATCPAHLIHLHFITPKLLNQYKSWSPSLCNSPVSHYFLPLLPSLSTLFSNALNQCSSLNVIVQRYLSIITTIWSKKKGKAIPLQAWTGPEGSSRLRLPDFKTIGTWRGQGCQPYAPAAFTPRKYSRC